MQYFLLPLFVGSHRLAGAKPISRDGLQQLREGFPLTPGLAFEGCLVPR